MCYSQQALRSGKRNAGSTRRFAPRVISHIFIRMKIARWPGCPRMSRVSERQCRCCLRKDSAARRRRFPIANWERISGSKLDKRETVTPCRAGVRLNHGEHGRMLVQRRFNFIFGRSHSGHCFSCLRPARIPAHLTLLNQSAWNAKARPWLCGPLIRSSLRSGASLCLPQRSPGLGV